MDVVTGADVWDQSAGQDPPSWAWDVVDAIGAMYPEDIARFRDHNTVSYSTYRDKPLAYIREILRIEPTPKQVEIAEKLLLPPYKVIAVSANNYGKSHLAGGLVNWWYDSFDPAICITTAPTDRDVRDVLWKEVRNQRRTRWDFPGDRAPELYDRGDHYAKGYTGNKAEAFHGRHDERMFFILDEAVALNAWVWTGVKSMFKANGKHLLLALLNPTDTTSPAYAEAQDEDRYHIVRLSALEHPNIIAQLKGNWSNGTRVEVEPHIPGAVDISQLGEWLTDPIKFEEIHEDDFTAGDVLWPPPWADQYGALDRYGRNGKRVCYRPGPEGQSRVLGLWPSATAGAIWSDLAWQAATRKIDGWKPLSVSWLMLPKIGCDVARGTSDRADKTSIICQLEGVAVEHRTASGWDTTRTMVALCEMADKWARIYNANRDPRRTQFCKPEHITINVDDATFGGGLVDQLKARGMRVCGVNASTAAARPDRYPRMRDQLWFAVPLAARRGEIDLSRLPKRSLIDLRKQCMAVQWKPDIHGRRAVEKKDDTKERLGRSPDDADALNLAFYSSPSAATATPDVFSSYKGPMPLSGLPADGRPVMGGSQ